MAERGTGPVSAEERERLAQHVHDHTEAGFVRKTGVPRQTVERALAGLPLRAGSRVVLREGLRELEGVEHVATLRDDGRGRGADE